MSDRDPPDKHAPDTTSEALLNATLEVVAERGLKGATTRLIAQRAGVNEVTLFRRYGNKTALLRAAIVSRSGMLRRDGVQYTGNLEHDLTHLTSEYQRILATVGPFLRVMLTEFSRHSELAGAVTQGPGQLFKDIGDLLTRYQQEGKLRPEPLTSLLPAFVGPIVLPFLVPEGVPALLLKMPFPTLDPSTHVERFLYGRAPQPQEQS